MKKVLCVLLGTMLVFLCAASLAEEAIRVAIGSQFSTLDPGLNTEVVNNYVISHIYAGMFTKDEDNNPVNDLCADYTISDDGLVYTFKIRDDAVWSDGVPVTANDFVYSYLRALSYGADNAWAVYDMVTYVAGAKQYNEKALEAGEDFDCTKEDHSGVGFKALDDKTLEITLSTPLPYLTKLMAANVWLPVREDFAPQHASLWAYEAGYPASGPFMLTWCSESEGATLTKNPSYVNADSVTLSDIEYVVMTDAAAQDMAFRSGEIDIAMDPTSETAMTYQGTDNLWLMPQCSNYFLAINSGSTGPEWAKNVNLRRALALAIDRNAVVDVLGGALLYPPLYGYVPTGVAGVEGDFRAEADAQGIAYDYDPDQAKALLAAEGYDESNPLHITYKYSNNGVHGDVATMLQAMWQAVGLSVDFDAVEAGVFYDQLDAGDFEISRYGYTTSDDAKQYLDLWTTNMQVVAAVDDPVFNQKVKDAGNLTDMTAYYTALHDAEDYLYKENCYVIPLFNYSNPVLVKSGVSGYRSLGGTVNFNTVVIE
ncbi:MAG: peptide ABC transporter substrate-binding protein [Clostridia bacterium]|nr:peptide ABC transporter substrate-binding protein [Clostridia bacterium]